MEVRRYMVLSHWLGEPSAKTRKAMAEVQKWIHQKWCEWYKLRDSATPTLSGDELEDGQLQHHNCNSMPKTEANPATSSGIPA